MRSSVWTDGGSGLMPRRGVENLNGGPYRREMLASIRKVATQGLVNVVAGMCFTVGGARLWSSAFEREFVATIVTLRQFWIGVAGARNHGLVEVFGGFL